MRPETFTITTFWLDWLLMPIMLVGAWLTLRWARADFEQASELHIKGESVLPLRAYSIPLYIAAAAWLIAGGGTLIREDFWEMRVIFVAFILWTLCCAVGAAIMVLSFVRRRRELGMSGILNLIGLLVMSLLMILPGLIDHSSPAHVTLVGHFWFVLLALSVGLLTGGVLAGYPFRFPRFALGLGVLFLIGWGLSEVTFRQASFPWMVRIWKLRLGLDYLDSFPLSDGWCLVGAVKALLGLSAVATLSLASCRRRAR